jgi:hypothetical protein
MTKPFWVFAGLRYYATGGVCGLIGCFTTHKEAVAHLQCPTHDEYGEVPKYEWYQIVNTRTGAVVQHFGGGGHGTMSRIECPHVTIVPADKRNLTE